MFRLVAILGAGLFLTLLIGGRDAGQTRLGLQGAYAIAALEDTPLSPDVTRKAVAGAAAAAPVASAAPAPALRVTQAAVTPATAPVAGIPVTDAPVAGAPVAGAPETADTLQAGLTLSLPPVAEPAAELPDALTAAAEPVALRIGRIIGSTVNVREGPSAKSAVLGRLARDEQVTVILTDGSGWSLVRIEGDGIEGYIATRYLSDATGDGALFPSE